VWPSPSSMSRSGRCSAQSFGVAVAWTSRTSSCWSCATRSRCCAARARRRSFAQLIGPCSRQRPAICQPPRAALVWSFRGRCCGGIGRSCAESGASRPVGADARESRLRCGPWCCGWHARIRAGAIGGSAVSSPNSACGYRQRRSVGCSLALDSGRPRGGRARVGGSSCAPRRRASSPATSSPSRACCCAATTCCSSSRTQAAASGSPAAHRVPPGPG
jgi:hypothetical protein